MTNDPNPFHGTPRAPYDDPYVQAALPADLGGGALVAPLGDSPAPYRYRTFDLPRTDPDYGKAKGFEYMVDDLRVGYVQHGEFARETISKTEGDFRGTSTAVGVDLRWRRHLIAAQKQTQQTFTTANGTTFQLFWTFIFDRLVMGCGAAANEALFVETSSTNPALTKVTYSPSSHISCLAPIMLAFPATTTNRLLVGRDAASPQILSDVTVATVDGTMHANLNPTWGMLLSPLNASSPGTGVNCFLANKGLWTLSVTAAIGDAPTQVLSNIPDGGYAIGTAELLNSTLGLRHYWFIPLGNVGNGAGYVLTTNLIGGDPLIVDFPVSYVKKVCIWNKMLIARDDYRVMSYDGHTHRDWEFMNQRVADTTTKSRPASFLITDNDFYILAAKEDGSGSTGQTNEILVLEKYDPTFNSWLPVSEQFTNGSSSASSYAEIPYTYLTAHLPTLPWSKQTNFMHMHLVPSGTTDYWDRMFIPQAGFNPYYRYSGAGSYATTWASGGAAGATQTSYWRSPFWSFPQAEGRPKKIDQIIFMGEVPTNTQVGIQFMQPSGTLGQEYTFNAGYSNVSQPTYTFDDTYYDEIQMQINLRQLTGTTRTANGLPVMVRGRFYMTDPGTENLGLPAG